MATVVSQTLQKWQNLPPIQPVSGCQPSDGAGEDWKQMASETLSK